MRAAVAKCAEQAQVGSSGEFRVWFRAIRVGGPKACFVLRVQGDVARLLKAPGSRGAKAGFLSSRVLGLRV